MIEDKKFFSKEISVEEIMRKNVRLKIRDVYEHLYGKYVFLWKVNYIEFTDYSFTEFLVMTSDFQRCFIYDDNVEQSIL